MTTKIVNDLGSKVLAKIVYELGNMYDTHTRNVWLSGDVPPVENNHPMITCGKGYGAWIEDVIIAFDFDPLVVLTDLTFGIFASNSTDNANVTPYPPGATILIEKSGFIANPITGDMILSLKEMESDSSSGQLPVYVPGPIHVGFYSIQGYPDYRDLRVSFIHKAVKEPIVMSPNVPWES